MNSTRGGPCGVIFSVLMVVALGVLRSQLGEPISTHYPGDDDPLFLQVKEATPPAHAPYLPELPAEANHEGKRVATFQRALQATSDLLLGWTTIDGRPFYVRQMKNMKGGMPVEFLEFRGHATRPHPRLSPAAAARLT